MFSSRFIHTTIYRFTLELLLKTKSTTSWQPQLPEPSQQVTVSSHLQLWFGFAVVVYSISVVLHPVALCMVHRFVAVNTDTKGTVHKTCFMLWKQRAGKLVKQLKAGWEQLCYLQRPALVILCVYPRSQSQFCYEYLGSLCEQHRSFCTDHLQSKSQRATIFWLNTLWTGLGI